MNTRRSIYKYLATDEWRSKDIDMFRDIQVAEAFKLRTLYIYVCR